jgi:hypothetical protein
LHESQTFEVSTKTIFLDIYRFPEDDNVASFPWKKKTFSTGAASDGFGDEITKHHAGRIEPTLQYSS